MAPQQMLTARGLAALKPGEWANDSRPRGSGQLQARKLATGAIAFYYRYTDSAGKQDRMPLGSALSLSQAREQAAALSLRYQAGERDLRRILEAERAPKPVERHATLGELLLAYAAALRGTGKISAGAVENALRLHVETPLPALWASPARSLGLDDLLPIIARIVAAGSRREAGKVRSYIRAAYAAAIRARQDASAPAALREMGLSSNPARDLATIEGGNNPRERVLSLAELRAYWKRIAVLDGATGGLLRFHLLTGCQRVAQLGRLTMADLDTDTGTVRLMDLKGRRKKPRVHLVPLLPPALAAIDVMRGEKLGPLLFTVAHGLEPAHHNTLTGAMDEVIAAMAVADELEGGRFTPGDLRRTVETRLAAIGQSDEARGQLQSHGLGGVQNRHYNRHRYDAEKLAALEALYALMVAEPGTVTPIRAARK
ncbi:MAG TPA: integrase arm-type DNA-binding domain-containing protein [Thermomonas sp.]|nr:integrase arm-type DNA-binding domain-containing protein [Thermomonas sp.]